MTGVGVDLQCPEYCEKYIRCALRGYTLHIEFNQKFDGSIGVLDYVCLLALIVTPPLHRRTDLI